MENGMMDEEEIIEESGSDENQTLRSSGNHPVMTLSRFLQAMPYKTRSIQKQISFKKSRKVEESPIIQILSLGS